MKGAGRTDLPLPPGGLTDGLVIVRPFARPDAAAVHAACADAEIARWIYCLPMPYALDDAEWFVDDAVQGLRSGVRARLAICEAGGTLAGSVSIDAAHERQAGEIGYWVAREARGRGFAAAAARLDIAWAFNDLGRERLELMTYPGNTASQALAAKLGFTREGVLRGYLAAEPGKDRAGRCLPRADGSLPERDDQVLFSLQRDDPPAPAG